MDQKMKEKLSWIHESKRSISTGTEKEVVKKAINRREFDRIRRVKITYIRRSNYLHPSKEMIRSELLLGTAVRQTE